MFFGGQFFLGQKTLIYNRRRPSSNRRRLRLPPPPSAPDHQVLHISGTLPFILSMMQLVWCAPYASGQAVPERTRRLYTLQLECGVLGGLYSHRTHPTCSCLLFFPLAAPCSQERHDVHISTPSPSPCWERWGRGGGHNGLREGTEEAACGGGGGRSSPRKVERGQVYAGPPTKEAKCMQGPPTSALRITKTKVLTPPPHQQGMQ